GGRSPIEVVLPDQGAGVAVELRHREVSAGPSIIGRARSDHVALRGHRDGVRLIATIGSPIEVVLPEQGAGVAVELRHREVYGGAGMSGKARSDHVALGGHRDGARLVGSNSTGGSVAIEGVLAGAGGGLADGTAHGEG